MPRKGEQRVIAKWITEEAIYAAIIDGEYNPDKVELKTAICVDRGTAESLCESLDCDRESRVSIEQWNGYAWSEVERWNCGERVTV